MENYELADSVKEEAKSLYSRYSQRVNDLKIGGSDDISLDSLKYFTVDGLDELSSIKKKLEEELEEMGRLQRIFNHVPELSNLKEMIEAAPKARAFLVSKTKEIKKNFLFEVKQGIGNADFFNDINFKKLIAKYMPEAEITIQFLSEFDEFEMGRVARVDIFSQFTPLIEIMEASGGRPSIEDIKLSDESLYKYLASEVLTDFFMEETGLRKVPQLKEDHFLLEINPGMINNIKLPSEKILFFEGASDYGKMELSKDSDVYSSKHSATLKVEGVRSQIRYFEGHIGGKGKKEGSKIVVDGKEINVSVKVPVYSTKGICSAPGGTVKVI